MNFLSCLDHVFFCQNNKNITYTLMLLVNWDLPTFQNQVLPHSQPCLQWLSANSPNIITSNVTISTVTMIPYYPYVHTLHIHIHMIFWKKQKQWQKRNTTPISSMYNSMNSGEKMVCWICTFLLIDKTWAVIFSSFDK